MKPNAATAQLQKIAPYVPALDDTHCRQFCGCGEWMPAPRKAYAILTVTTPVWFAGDLIGCDEETHPVAIPAGQTIGDQIAGFDCNARFTATPCTREQYMAALAAQREEQEKIEQDQAEWEAWLDSPEGIAWF